MWVSGGSLVSSRGTQVAFSALLPVHCLWGQGLAPGVPSPRSRGPGTEPRRGAWGQSVRISDFDVSPHVSGSTYRSKTFSFVIATQNSIVWAKFA